MMLIDSDLFFDGKGANPRRWAQGQTKQPVRIRNIALHSCSECVVPFGVENGTSNTTPYCY